MRYSPTSFAIVLGITMAMAVPIVPVGSAGSVSPAGPVGSVGSVGQASATQATAAGAPLAVEPAAGQPCGFPVSKVDATGTEVTVEEEPQRIVVLSPSPAQILWDIGARGKVVGMPVRQYTEYLNGSGTRENVVNPDGTDNVEKVVALDPDLVLAANIDENATVEKLRDAGLTVYKAGFGKSLTEIYAKTRLFGRLVGACDGAASTVSETKAEVREIRAAVEGRDRPRVLYYFFNFTAGSATFVHDAIEIAGGDNVAANAGIEGFKRFNPEIVADRNPEWVVIPSDASFPGGEPYESTIAYRQNQTLAVNTNYMSQPGPRVVIPMRTMAEAFHPGAFREPTASPTATSSPTGTPSSPTPTPPSNGTGAPGFGFVPAVGALLAVALFARRRRRS